MSDARHDATGARLPHVNRFFVRGDDELAVCAERNARQTVGMSAELSRATTGGGFPEPHGLVVAGSRNKPTVGTESCRSDSPFCDLEA